MTRNHFRLFIKQRLTDRQKFGINWKTVIFQSILVQTMWFYGKQLQNDGALNCVQFFSGPLHINLREQLGKLTNRLWLIKCHKSVYAWCYDSTHCIMFQTRWDCIQLTLMLWCPSGTQERRLTGTSKSWDGWNSGRRCVELAYCADAVHLLILVYRASRVSPSLKTSFFR